MMLPQFPHVRFSTFTNKVMSVRLPSYMGLFALVFILGCGVQQDAVSVPREYVLKGIVYGGQRPVSSSQLEVYAVDSKSLTNPLISEPVRSDQAGSFSVSIAKSCPSPDSLVYLVANGGNPGLVAGMNNSAIELMAALGPCRDLSTHAFVTVNEVTTVGSILPLSAYAKSSAQIGPGNGDIAQYEAALETVDSLIDVAAGSVRNTMLVPEDDTPASRLNTLANILSSCVASGGGTAGDGSICGQLFSFAATGSSAPPTTTFMAALAIGQNPRQNVASLFALSSQNTHFMPALTSPPLNWVVEFLRLPASPVISPASGTYASGQPITIASTSSGSVVYYTTDGTAPTRTSSVYGGPIMLLHPETVRAIAATGQLRSLREASATYKVSLPVSVTLSPGSVVLQPSQTHQFIASVTNAPNTGVNWTLSPAVGSLSPSGFYTAPATIMNSQTVTVAATSLADNTKMATAAVTLQPLVGISEQAQSALRFIDSMGVNTHFGYIDTGYGNADFIASEVEKLGVKHVRDGTALVANSSNYPAAYAAMLRMGGTGIRFAAGNGITKSPGVMTHSSSSFQSGLTNFTVNGVSYIEALEGANEVDVADQQNWPTDWVTDQQDLVAADTMNVPIYSTTLAFPGDYRQIAAQASNPNIPIYGNLHVYAGNANPGVFWPDFFNNIRVPFPTQTIVATETGYYDATASGTGYVDAATQAKYLPRTFLENFRAGIYRTYIYELLDEVSTWNSVLQETSGPNTCVQCSYGLVTSSGIEKPSFTAVKNLISILNNGATPSPSGSLTYSITGGNANLHHILLQKSPGVFDLILWQEISSFNASTSTQVANAALTVTLSVNASSVSTYNPTASTTPALQSMNGFNVGIQVPDEALVVEITTTPNVP